MNYWQVIIFSASIWIAAIIGWARFSRIQPGYLPFLICISVASLNELVSFILTRNGYFTIINNNIYVLLEGMLITWQFRNWGLFSRHRIIFYMLLATLSLLWTLENLTSPGQTAINFYFRIAYSFMIVIMSIHINNLLIVTCRGRLLKSPVFLICSGFIIYFTYKILVEAFWLYGLHATRHFRINVYLMLTWINLIVNLIYAVALLWIPRKPQHITLS